MGDSNDDHHGKKDGAPAVPDDHPRAQSLHDRHVLVDGMRAKVVTPSGLCAHGRGEAFDYLLGEITIPPAEDACRAAVATMILAKHPIISVNGNTAALVAKEFVELSKVTGAPLEVNIFYKAPGRLEAIEKVLREAGATQILGLGDVESVDIPELTSNRRVVDPRGIHAADVVFVPLEDGDRTEALIAMGKTVITCDLNPLSRTAQKAHITIVDNIVRCVPVMIEIAKSLRAEFDADPSKEAETLKTLKNNFNQRENLALTLDAIIRYLQTQK